MKPSTMNFCHSQDHSLGKVKETEVIEAFGLFIFCCVVGLWRANRAFGDSQNCSLLTHLLGEILSGH